MLRFTTPRSDPALLVLHQPPPPSAGFPAPASPAQPGRPTLQAHSPAGAPKESRQVSARMATADTRVETAGTRMETADRGEAAPEAPEPSRIDVHIHQESALATLLIRACSQLRSPTPDAVSRTRGRSRLLVASWVVQIVLGVLSGTLGGFLYFFHFCTLRGSGAALWTGAVAVLAGAVAFIYEKRGGIYWALLKTLLALATFATSIAAVAIGARYFHEYKFHFRNYICQVSSTGLSWGAAPWTTPSPEETRRLHLCLSYLSMLKALFISFQAMLLGVWVLLFLASLVPLCLYCWRRSQSKKETDQKKLLEVRETQLCFS
ncbi:transmembrane protein 176A isoform X1 [Mustela putorius furo]|uniref:Transmembrane protein 176A isoform X1 n=3 Tax=Mustela putorius furo TaxID=9669 RepID=A0A8U0T1H5_MUSPF|nr:transmembrane protein 176A isoform X1 [Mustela putorius furo]